jgi:hypothetical protein
MERRSANSEAAVIGIEEGTTTMRPVKTRFRRAPRRVLLLLAAPLIALLTGCSNELVIHAVQGTVSLDGQPVQYGEMNVDPLSTKPNSGRSVVCRIVDGKYDLSSAGIAAGPAEFTITVIDTSKLRIKDFENITPDEDSRIMMAKKLLFSEKVEVDRDEIDISLKTENGQQKTPRSG